MNSKHLAALAAVTLVACGGDDDDAESADSTATSAPAATNAPDATSSPDATSAPDATTIPEVSLVPVSTVPTPDVQIPDEIPTELVVTELRPGEGAEAADGDSVVVNYVGVRSEEGLFRWLAEFGQRARIVEPARLARAYEDRIRAARARYEDAAAS